VAGVVSIAFIAKLNDVVMQGAKLGRYRTARNATAVATVDETNVCRYERQDQHIVLKHPLHRGVELDGGEPMLDVARASHSLKRIGKTIQYLQIVICCL
jgi:hypothetical protein